MIQLKRAPKNKLLHMFIRYGARTVTSGDATQRNATKPTLSFLTKHDITHEQLHVSASSSLQQRGITTVIDQFVVGSYTCTPKSTNNTY